MSVKLNESQIKYLGINKKNDLNYNLEINGTTHTNGRIYSDEWVQFNETTKGLYWPNGNNAHLYPNNVGSYGSLIVTGDRGGYNGILLGDTQDYMVVMSGLEHQGLYNQANNKWIVYYNKANGRIGIGTSGLQEYSNTISGTSYFCNNTYTHGLITSYEGFFYQSSDATLKIYNYANNNTYGAECIAMQTCFDRVDGSTHAYVTDYGYRCNLLLQPRGGQVLIRLSPVSDVSGRYSLQVGGNECSAWFQSTVDVGSINSNHYAEFNVCRMSNNGSHTGMLHQSIQPDTSFGQLLYIYDGSTTSGFCFRADRIQALKDIYGTLRGNADTATADSDGYAINTTYLKRAGGIMGDNAFINWPDSGSWGSSSATFPLSRGGLYWSGTSDWIRLFAEETASDMLNLVAQFGDDGNSGIVIRNHSGSTMVSLYATGTVNATTVNATTFNGALNGNASTATVFNSNRTIALSGAVTGSVASNGSGWSIATTIAEKAISPTNFTSTFRTQTKGDTNYTAYLSVIRNDNTDSWGYMPIYGSGIAFGRYDTHTYLYTNYSSAQAYIGGGNSDRLNWIKNIAFGDGTGASGTWGINISGNAATASIWQTARTLTIGNTGKLVNGGSNVSWSLEEIGLQDGYKRSSFRDFTNGTLITTSIDYSQTNGAPWSLEIKGNSYGSLLPFKFVYQGYNYDNTIIQHGGYCLGISISGIVAFNHGGKLCFWFPRQGYWQGFAVWVTEEWNATARTNQVVSITDSAKPSGITKEVALNNIYMVLRSDNYHVYADARYINASGDTMSGALNFKNSTWNLVGDDAYFGDNDTAGSFAIKGANGTTNLKMVTYGGTSYGTITWNGSSFTLSNSVVIGSGSHYYMTYNGGAYFVLHNHNNGNVSVNAANGGLYVGYYNTGSLNFGPEAQWGYVTANSGWVFSLGITAANVTSNGRAYMNEWIQFNTNNGLYWPNHYSIHICGNDVSTYGGVRIRGAKNGYHGIICGDSSIHMNVMSSDEHQGLFNESNSRWIVYYSRPNNIMALGGSDVSAGYTVNINGSLYVGGSQGVYTTTYYSNAITTIGNAGTWTTAPVYTNAIINFGYRAHDPVGSYYYTPWLGGIDAVSGYGYGATVTAGLYHGSDYADGGFYIGTSWDGSGNDTFFRFSRAGTLTAVKVYGAVWNDYAEYRDQTEELKPGQVACCGNDGKLKQTTERLQKFEGVVSDTFGFAIGETENCKTPLAVSGRVLVYTYEDRSTFNSGDCVCAAPNGQVSKMTREEIAYYPDRIVGVVSEIPDYEVWGTGNVNVDNRIWIKVK